jgi:hypothetical protein
MVVPGAWYMCFDSYNLRCAKSTSFDTVTVCTVYAPLLESVLPSAAMSIRYCYHDHLYQMSDRPRLGLQGFNGSTPMPPEPAPRMFRVDEQVGLPNLCVSISLLCYTGPHLRLRKVSVQQAEISNG